MNVNGVEVDVQLDGCPTWVSLNGVPPSGTLSVQDAEFIGLALLDCVRRAREAAEVRRQDKMIRALGAHAKAIESSKTPTSGGPRVGGTESGR